MTKTRFSPPSPLKPSMLHCSTIFNSFPFLPNTMQVVCLEPYVNIPLIAFFQNKLCPLSYNFAFLQFMHFNLLLSWVGCFQPSCCCSTGGMSLPITHSYLTLVGFHTVSEGLVQAKLSLSSQLS